MARLRNDVSRPSMKISRNTALLALFILPLAFDFKGAEGGGITQIGLAALTIGMWARLFFANGRMIAPVGKLWRLAFLALLVTLAGSVVSFLISDALLGNYARVFMPWLLLAMGFSVALRKTFTGNIEQINSLMYVGCGLSVIFTVFIGFTQTGLGFEEIRYQILSPVLLSFEAILLHQLLVERQRTVGAVFALIGCLAVQLFSVTRSSLLGFALILLAALWLSSTSISRFTRNTFTYSSGLAVIGVGAMIFAVTLYPELYDRWFARVFNAREVGVDITTVTRIAEIEEQLALWSQDITSILFGKGYGAEYSWSSEYFQELSAAFRISDLAYDNYFDAGHNFWVYSLFAGGLFFGTALPTLILYAGYRGVKMSRHYTRTFGEQSEVLALSRSTLVLVSFIAFTIGGNPLSYRYTGLVSGLALGVLVASHSMLYRKARRNAGVPDSRRVRIAT
jgi:hypothetical protein